MNFTNYVQTVEEYRKIKDMSDLVSFNMYDNFDDFKYDVHAIYDGKYDKALKRNENFYHLLIDGEKPTEDIAHNYIGGNLE